MVSVDNFSGGARLPSLAVQSPVSSGRWGPLSPSVVEAVAWATAVAGDRAVNSAHILFGLTLAHGEGSEVRQLLGFFGEREDRLFKELPDLDNASVEGPPPTLNGWPAMTEVADQIYAAATELRNSVPYSDRKIHIPHLMAALINVRPEAAIALEMALPPLPPFWLQYTYAEFLPSSSSGTLKSFLESRPRPDIPQVRLVEREEVLRQLDSAVSTPGAQVSVQTSPGAGSTAVLLEFLQRSARRYRDGVSYANGMGFAFDTTLRVPDGRLVVVDHVPNWPSQMSITSTGTLVAVAPPLNTGTTSVFISPLSEEALQQVAVQQLGAVGVRPSLGDVKRLLELAGGRVDLLVAIITGYPPSGPTFEVYLAWAASVPPGSDEIRSAVTSEESAATSAIVALSLESQEVLKAGAFLGFPTISLGALGAMTGIPEANLMISLQRLAAAGLLTPDEGGSYRIPAPVARATRRTFAYAFEPFYFMRLIAAAAASGANQQITPQADPPAVAPPSSPLPSEPASIPTPTTPASPAPPSTPTTPTAPAALFEESLGYTPTDYATDSVDDADGLLGADALNRGADVEAVCMLATLKAAKPPLSIGLFGEWGSGKTFFMRMVDERIRKRSDQLKGGSSVFCTRVKHIWFNAWHYSDDELWASLVTHIFEELSQETKLTPPSIDEQKASLDNEIKGLKQTAGQAAVAAVLRDQDVQRELDKLGIPSESLAQLIDIRNWLIVVWRRLRWGHRAIVVGTVVAALAAVALLATRRDLLSLAVALIPVIGAYLTFFKTPARETLDFANRASQKLKQADEARQAKIASLERERRALDQPVETFIRQRLDSNDYAKKMGLISTARKDFEELSKRLAGPSMSDPDRIILYIDDLDRCSAKVVVQVLEAIHLLLAFELFVVIVGVDSRWLVAALEQHLKLVAESENGERASAQDYLEKIFQVPIQVKRMGPDDFRTLVEDIVGDAVRLPPPTAPAATAAPVSVPAPTTAVASMPVVVPVAAPPQTIAPSNGGQPPATIPAAPMSAPSDQPTVPVPTAPSVVLPPPAVPGAPPPDDPTIEPNPEKLQLYEAEVDLLKRMSPLISTPRSAKRLLNTYRLVRAGIDGSKLRTFVPDDGSPGPYQPAILLLSIMIGFPGEFSELFCAIRDGGTAGFSAVLEDERWGSVKQKVDEALRDVTITDDLNVFRKAMPLVSRYSFKEWETSEVAAVANATATRRPTGQPATT